MRAGNGVGRKGISCYCFLEQPNGKYLFAKRSSKSKWNPGKWDIPGGKMSFGETPEQTVRREVKEETAQKITELVLFDTISVHVKKPDKDLHTVRILFYGKAKGKAKKNYESAKLKTCTLKEATKLDFVPKMKAELKKFSSFIKKKQQIKKN